jgi:hypothetical protein
MCVQATLFLALVGRFREYPITHPQSFILAHSHLFMAGLSAMRGLHEGVAGLRSRVEELAETQTGSLNRCSTFCEALMMIKVVGQHINMALITSQMEKCQ